MIINMQRYTFLHELYSEYYTFLHELTSLHIIGGTVSEPYHSNK